MISRNPLIEKLFEIVKEQPDTISGAEVALAVKVIQHFPSIERQNLLLDEVISAACQAINSEFPAAGLPTQIQNNKLVDSRDKENNTLLFYAACNGHTVIVHALLAAGATVKLLCGGVEYYEKYTYTALHAAISCRKNNAEIVDALVGALTEAKETVDVRIISRGGMTALHVASRGSSPIIVGKLIQAGADVNAQDSNNWTPLHYVANSLAALGTDIQIDIINILIQAKANLNPRNNKGETPLDRAYNSRIPKDLLAIHLLLKAGAVAYSPHQLFKNLRSCDLAIWETGGYLNRSKCYMHNNTNYVMHNLLRQVQPLQMTDLHLMRIC